MHDSNPRTFPGPGWKDALVADLARVALRDRWGRALIAVGWVHLAVFLVCHLLYVRGDRAKTHFVALWGLEFAANLLVLRRLAGRGWAATPIGGVLVRVWATFLILSFNVASLNSLTGWGVEWFKLAWTTLSTFGFATTAYLASLWFFVPAVQMYFTGLLMARFPNSNYLIYGLSWWAALQGIGLTLERRRLRAARPAARADDRDDAESAAA